MLLSRLVPQSGERDWEGIIKRFGFLLLSFLLDISLANKKQGWNIFLSSIHYKIFVAPSPYFSIISIKAVTNVMPNENGEILFKNK